LHGQVKGNQVEIRERYPKEFQRQMVDLYRAGNTLTNLSQRFGPTPWAFCRWVKQADRDEGRDDGGLNTAERDELVRLRRENKRLPGLNIRSS
jgi:transposase